METKEQQIKALRCAAQWARNQAEQAHHYAGNENNAPSERRFWAEIANESTLAMVQCLGAIRKLEQCTNLPPHSAYWPPFTSGPPATVLCSQEAVDQAVDRMVSLHTGTDYATGPDMIGYTIHDPGTGDYAPVAQSCTAMPDGSIETRWSCGDVEVQPPSTMTFETVGDLMREAGLVGHTDVATGDTVVERVQPDSVLTCPMGYMDVLSGTVVQMTNTDTYVGLESPVVVIDQRPDDRLTDTQLLDLMDRWNCNYFGSRRWWVIDRSDKPDYVILSLDSYDDQPKRPDASQYIRDVILWADNGAFVPSLTSGSSEQRDTAILDLLDRYSVDNSGKPYDWAYHWITPRPICILTQELAYGGRKSDIRRCIREASLFAPPKATVTP